MNPLLFSIKDGIASIVLNRPAVGNAIDFELGQSLADAAIICDRDPTIRCVLLSGAGRSFCTGGDIEAFQSPDMSTLQAVGELARRLHVAMALLANMPKPLVVLVNGPAAGAGFGLAMIGDIVLAAPSAHFTPAYSRLGLTADGGITWTLPRLVGLRRAQEILLTNRRVTAVEAEALGMVSRVVEEDALDEEGTNIARSFVDGPTSALAEVRQLLQESSTSPFQVHLEKERRTIAGAAAGAEGQEGLAAFLEKRQADFIGALDRG